MSERARSTILLIFGLIGVLGTIGTQVLGVGEIKGTVMAMLKAHDKRFEEHSHRLDQHDSQISTTALQIERIKGKIGIVSVKSDSSNTASNTSTETDQP